MKNTGFILFGLAVCAAADVCAQSAQLELGVEDIAGAAVKEEKLDFGQKKQARTKTDKVTSTIGDTLDLFGGEDKSKEKKTVSLEEMKQKAAAGDIEAQLDLGYMYLYGVNRRPKKRTPSLLTIWAACISMASEPKSIIRQP